VESAVEEASAQFGAQRGVVKVRDRYTVLKDSLVFAACGG